MGQKTKIISGSKNDHVQTLSHLNCFILHFRNIYCTSIQKQCFQLIHTKSELNPKNDICQMILKTADNLHLTNE